jgi:hypothetical protein
MAGRDGAMWWAIYLSASGRQEEFDGNNDGVGCKQRPHQGRVKVAEIAA